MCDYGHVKCLSLHARQHVVLAQIFMCDRLPCEAAGGEAEGSRGREDAGGARYDSIVDHVFWEEVDLQTRPSTAGTSEQPLSQEEPSSSRSELPRPEVRSPSRPSIRNTDHTVRGCAVEEAAVPDCCRGMTPCTRGWMQYVKPSPSP